MGLLGIGKNIEFCLLITVICYLPGLLKFDRCISLNRTMLMPVFSIMLIENEIELVKQRDRVEEKVKEEFLY